MIGSSTMSTNSNTDRRSHQQNLNGPRAPSVRSQPSSTPSRTHESQNASSQSGLTPVFHPIQPAFPFRRLTFTSERKYAARDTPLHHLHVVLQTIKQQILESRGKWKIDLIVAPENPASYLNANTKTKADSAVGTSQLFEEEEDDEEDDDYQESGDEDEEESYEEEVATNGSHSDTDGEDAVSDAESRVSDTKSHSSTCTSDDDSVSGDELRDLFMDQEENMLEPFGFQVDTIVDNLSLANSQDLSHMVPDWMSPFVTQHRLRLGPSQPNGTSNNRNAGATTQPRNLTPLFPLSSAPLIRDEMLSALSNGALSGQHMISGLENTASASQTGRGNKMPRRANTNLTSSTIPNNRTTIPNGGSPRLTDSLFATSTIPTRRTTSRGVAASSLHATLDIPVAFPNNNLQSNQVISALPPAPPSQLHTVRELNSASPSSAPPPRQDSSHFIQSSSSQSRPSSSQQNSVSSNARWTPEYDHLLLSAYEQYGASWTRIQKDFFPDRTISSLRARHRILSEEPAATGNWSVEEDDALRECVALHGTNWSKVSEAMRGMVTAESFEGRSANQCMYRWNKVLHPFLKRGPWTEEEDAAVVNAIVQNGLRWSEISRVVPGRTDRQIRNRFGKRGGRWALTEEPWTPDENARLLRAYYELGTRWGVIAERLPPRSESEIRHQLPIVLLEEIEDITSGNGSQILNQELNTRSSQATNRDDQTSSSDSDDEPEQSRKRSRRS